MEEIHKIGEWYGHFYEEDGVEKFVECSKEEYESLGKKGAGAPDVKGKWITSGCYTKYDTKSGFMEDGTYLDIGNKMIVKTADGAKSFCEYDNFDRGAKNIIDISKL